MLRTGDLTLKLAAVLVLHVLDDHHELRPGPADDSSVAGIEGGGDVVDGQQLRDGAVEVMTEPGDLGARQDRDQTQPGRMND